MTTEKIKILKMSMVIPLGGQSNDTFVDGMYEMHRDGSNLHVLHKPSGESFSFHTSRALWWKPFYKPLSKEQLAKPEKDIGASEKTK
jgi:hypothetical protein